MPKPTKPAGFILQMLGMMLLVGAVMLAIGGPPAVRLAIVSGVAGVVFFVLGGRVSR
jgi:hypothetical protein